MADHEFGEISHDWLSLHVEIPQPSVAPPASNEADDFIVDSKQRSAMAPAARRDLAETS